MRIVVLFILFFGVQLAFSQDLHFTQYGILRTYFNPAQTGDFFEDYRISGIHRNQWRNVSKPYSTFGLGGEKSRFKFLPGLGVGLHVFNDVAGTSNFTTNRIAADLAYHIPLFDSTHQLSLGVTPEFIFQSVDLNRLTFGDQYLGNNNTLNNPTGEVRGNISGSKPNFSLGANYKVFFNNRKVLQIGGVYANLSAPEVIEGNQSSFESRYLASISYQFPISRNILLAPNTYYNLQGNFKELFGGLNAEWILKNGRFNYQSLLFGVMHRWQDAWSASVGLKYQNWQFGFAYDVNTSAFNTATEYRGAYELGFVYVFNVFNESHRRFKTCPTFI